MRRRAGILAPVAAALALVATGCPYRTGSALTGRYRSIGVPMFRNETRIPDLEHELTRAVAELFRAESGLEVMDVGTRDPDLVLLGRVAGYEQRVRRTDRLDRAVEQRVEIRARVTVRADDGRVLLKDVVVRNTETDPESGVWFRDLGEDELAGRRRAVDDLARAIVRAALDWGWDGEE